jgi:MFS family permease
VSALATSALVSTGLVFHQVSLLADHGVSVDVSLSTLSLQAAFACAMSVIGGCLADRIPARSLLSLSMVFLGLSIVLLLCVDSVSMVVPYAALLGLHTGIQRCSGALALMTAFGRTHFGAIKGTAMSIVIGASALGPLPLALAKDYLGRYDVALAGMLILPILSAVAVGSAHPSGRPLRPVDLAADGRGQ